MGKLNTPRRLMPSVRVGAMRPISSGGTAVEGRVFQGSSTNCIFIVFQASFHYKVTRDGTVTQDGEYGFKFAELQDVTVEPQARLISTNNAQAGLPNLITTSTNPAVAALVARNSRGGGS
jgi:hypothetical protein